MKKKSIEKQQREYCKEVAKEEGKCFGECESCQQETVLDEEEEDEEKVDVSSESVNLEKQLEKALAEENYELASKIRDLIKIYKSQK